MWRGQYMRLFFHAPIVALRVNIKVPYQLQFFSRVNNKCEYSKSKRIILCPFPQTYNEIHKY
jgi:hypothetical protein